MCDSDTDTCSFTTVPEYANEHETVTLCTENRHSIVVISERGEDTNDKELICTIHNRLIEYHKILQGGLLEREKLLDIIVELNGKAKMLDINNHCLNLTHKLIFKPFEKHGPMYYGINYRKWLLLLIIFVFHLCNTLSVIALCVNYAVQEQFWYSGLTFICISIPSTCYTFAIYCTKRISRDICIAIFNISPILCCFHIIKQAKLVKSLSKGENISEQERCFVELFKQYTITLENMKQLVGFLSCAPQLSLQVAIFLTFVRSDVDFVRKGLNWFSIGTSCVGLLIALQSRFKNVIFERPWLLPMMFARVLSLCILTYRYPTNTFIFITIHWVALAIWWYVYEVRHSIRYSRGEKILFALSEALVTTFVPLKFLDLDLNLFLYVFYFAQILGANSVWFHSFDELANSEYLYVLVICINVSYFVAGIVGKWLCVNFKTILTT